MKRAKWKAPLHYILLILEGYIFSFGAIMAIKTFPSESSLLYAMLCGFGFAMWIITDVFPEE